MTCLQSEELHQAVTECSWVNKPHWFKKGLLLMMLRTCKPLQIKPYGLYVLDVKNIVVVIFLLTRFFFHKRKNWKIEYRIDIIL